MGSVYRVRDLVLDEHVALKILRKDLSEVPGEVRRFQREVKLARRVHHPNVVRIFDVGQHEDEHFCTMECVVGDAVADLVSTGRPLEVERALDVALQIAAGLSATHAAGLIHRDLKPSNVLVSRDGRVVITDFGVAIASDDPSAPALPMHGAGTPLYMAPEQIEGRAVDARTDLYALGLILFEMLTGSNPWPSDAERGSGLARLSVPPPSPRTLNDKVPEALARLVLGLLGREPGERPPNVAAVIAALQAAREELRSRPASSPVPPSPSRKPSLRPPYPAIATTNSPHVRSVAVLPLRNAGGAGDSYLAEALTAELADRLVSCPGVRVASPRSLRLEEPGDPLEIGRRADVDVVVEGSVAKPRPGVLLVAVRMLDTERGFVLWSGEFERASGELFDLHAEIAGAVIDALTLEEVAPRADRGPENPEDVDAFVRAKREYAQWTPESIARAAESLRALATDSPGDPHIVSYLALAQLRLWAIGSHASSERASDALSLLRGVLEASPYLGEAHLALGIHAMLDVNWVLAARRMEEAVRCNPALPDAHAYLGILRGETNHVEQGMHMLEVALRLDPKNLPACWGAAALAALVGQSDKALEMLARADRVVELHPSAVVMRLRVALWSGDRDAVAAARALAARMILPKASLESYIARLFLEAEPDREIGAITAVAASADTPAWLRGRLMQLVAERCALAGRTDEAWAALRAAAPNSVDTLWFHRCPALARLTRMPAFLTLRTQVARQARLVFDATVPGSPRPPP
jgi:serine/threonine-protein kinase